METFVRLPKELREELREKVLKVAVAGLKENMEEVCIGARRLEGEIDDLLTGSFPVSYMLRNVIKECREFIAIDGGEVIMRITRKNRFWRDIILGWIKDRDVADATVGLLRQNYWSKRCISSKVGIINNGVVDEEEISFHVLKNFVYRSKKVWQGRKKNIGLMDMLGWNI